MLSVPASKLIPNAGFTVSVAPALVTVPPALLTATLYTLAVSGNCGEEMAYVTGLAPATSILLRFHWYAKLPSPLATTEKLAASPTLTD
jgi:hypothetical protein